MGRSVNDTIWDRWYPPEASNYAELVCPCRDYVYLGEINEEELNRLNFELKELSSMMADSQDEDSQDEVEVGVAINRGTSGGIKVLSGTIMIVGSVAGIAAVVASGGTALPVVVMALGTAMIMFGASDTIEGIGDIQAAISRQGLDQMSYNPVRESVFGGNETAYALTETGVSFVFDVITGMAIAKMPTRLKTPAQAFRATSAAGVATEASAVREAESGVKSTLEPNLQLFASDGLGNNLSLSIKSVLKNVDLPVTGKIRYIPPKTWTPGQILPKQNGGYIDRFGNIWTKGPSRTAGQAFEWDVQLSRTGKSQMGWLSRDGSHLNVSLGGEITHK